MIGGGRARALRAEAGAWALASGALLPLRPGWPWSLAVLAPLLGVMAAAAWLPGLREHFELRPAVPCAALAATCAVGLATNALNARLRFTPLALLASVVVMGAALQAFSWTLVLCSRDPGAIVFGNTPILVAASHAMRLRPTLRFAWPLAGHAVGFAAAFALAPPERVGAFLAVGPLVLAAGLVFGSFAERLRRARGVVDAHAAAIRAHELEVRAAELAGLSESLLELMQRGHDARSSLSGALLDADELERLAAREPPGEEGEALRAGARALREALERLRRLVDTRSVHAASAAADGKAEPAVAVVPAVEKALAAARRRTPAATLAVGPGAAGARARVAGGEESLCRMLDALVENAWQGDGARGASRVDVEVSAEQRAGALAIAVRDDGPGFAAEQLARPLAPFVTRKHGGLGLGLYTTECLARASGGSLRRESLPAGGALVTLYLQLAPRGEDEGRDGAPPAPRP